MKSTVPYELFKLDSLASNLIDAWKKGSDLPPSQKSKLFADKAFWNALEFPDDVPTPIIRRLQLVYLCHILDKQLFNNSIKTLNSAYKVFKNMDYPAELEYSEEFLNLLVDFKTQLLIGNLMEDTSVYDKILQHFVQNLQVHGQDEAKAEIINKRWLAKCQKRKKYISLFASVDQLKIEFQESEFLEKIRSFLMITGDYLNQKHPPAEIRRQLKTNMSRANDECIEISSSTNSRVEADDKLVGVQSSRTLPSSFFEKKGARNTPNVSSFPVNKDETLTEPASAVGLNDNIRANLETKENSKNAADDVGIDHHTGRVPVSDYEKAFSNLKSYYCLDEGDLNDMAEKGLQSADKDVIRKELAHLKKKIEIAYNGYSNLQKYMNCLKSHKWALQNILRPRGSTSNELPWTDDEEDDERFEESKISKDRQNFSKDKFVDRKTEVLDYDIHTSSSDELFTNATHHIAPSSTRSSPRSKKTNHVAETRNGRLQLAQYKNIDVYEIRCNNVYVLRRISDGWVNFSTILQASSLDESEKLELEKSLPDPTERIVGSRYSKLQGIWVPVETGKKIAGILKLKKDLDPLFAIDMNLELDSGIPHDDGGSHDDRNVHELKRPRISPKTKVPEIETAGVQLAQYKRKDVYEISVNNVFVLRRVSDGWVNATTILEASNLDDAEKESIVSKISSPNERLIGAKYSRLQGVWVPLKTAKQIALLCKLEKELYPLFTYSN